MQSNGANLLIPMPPTPPRASCLQSHSLQLQLLAFRSRRRRYVPPCRTLLEWSRANERPPGCHPRGSRVANGAGGITRRRGVGLRNRQCPPARRCHSPSQPS